MQISERVRTMKPSLTLSVNTRAMELRAQGIQVTSLAVGEPDFPTPKHICEAAKAAIDANFCRYTAVPGIPELRAAVGGYFKKFYGEDIAGSPHRPSTGHSPRPPACGPWGSGQPSRSNGPSAR